MNKGRLEAFSDGVIAVIITIMVLELKAPHGSDWIALRPLLPLFLNYLLSFIFIGIYWNNHHHMLQATHHVNGKILWANLHLLFWLSLIPFTTSWMGENFSAVPVAVYGVNLLFSGLAFNILARALIKHHGKDSPLAIAAGGSHKGNISLVLYAFAIPSAFWNPWISCALYITVAILWLIPSRRIEKTLAEFSS